MTTLHKQLGQTQVTKIHNAQGRKLVAEQRWMPFPFTNTISKERTYARLGTPSTFS